MPITKAIEQIWAAYNAILGGQIVAIHFEDVVRTKKQGESNVDVQITAKAQLEGFKKSDQIALNLNGQIKKHEVLVYDGDDLSRNKNAAGVVIAWAITKGLKPIVKPGEKAAMPFEQERRLSSLEARMGTIEDNVAKILDAVSAPKK